MSVWTMAVRIAEENTEFDPNKVTPGFEGFVFTALMAAGVIVLGFLLVSRLRRGRYRSEVREQITDELSGGHGDGTVADPRNGGGSPSGMDPRDEGGSPAGGPETGPRG